MKTSKITTSSFTTSSAVPNPKRHRLQLTHVRRRLTEEFGRLLGCPSSANVRWCGTVSDLVELTYVAWVCGRWTDAQGHRRTLVSLVSDICQRLHAKCPASISAVLHNISCRKGIRTSSLPERCLKIIFEEGEHSPITHRFVKWEKKKQAVSQPKPVSPSPHAPSL